MTAVATVLLLLGCWPLAAAGNFLPNAPMHVPRIGRRSDTEQVGRTLGEQQTVGQAVRASKSLYYQLPRNYPRVGRKDPSMPTYHHSNSERLPSSDEELLALWRRAAILDEGNGYNGARAMDTNYGAVTAGKEQYESTGQYTAGDGAMDELKYDTGILEPSFTRGTRYDGSLFRSLRGDRAPFDDDLRYGDTGPEGADYDGRDPPKGQEGDRRRGSFLTDCRGRECSPTPDPLERLVKSLLKEIISRRLAGEESVVRQTDTEGAAKIPRSRQLW